jgi:hypothetical protein
MPPARGEIAPLRSRGKLFPSAEGRSVSKETPVKLSQWLTFTLATVILALEVLALTAVSSTVAVPAGTCDLRLNVGLTPDVPNPRDEGFLSSLLSNHAGYRLIFLHQEPDSVVLDLTGPGPAYSCRNVIETMRHDARVLSVDVEREPQ